MQRQRGPKGRGTYTAMPEGKNRTGDEDMDTGPVAHIALERNSGHINMQVLLLVGPGFMVLSETFWSLPGK